MYVDEPVEDIAIESKPFYEFVKRCFDIVASVIALILLAVPMLIVAVLIKRDSKGPVVYVQTRVGKNGREFQFYKFRTMIDKADTHLEKLLSENEMDGPVFKIKDDPRITKIGKILRKTSIDELPQIINVIAGDMSFVGPRPPLPREVALYTERHKLRLAVKPGLTCYWQVQPSRNDISFEDWVTFDIKYIKERNFLVDIKLILMTFKVVLHKEGC